MTKLRCPICNNLFDEADGIDIKGDGTICPHCGPEYTSFCAVCGDAHWLLKMQQLDTIASKSSYARSLDGKYACSRCIADIERLEKQVMNNVGQ